MSKPAEGQHISPQRNFTKPIDPFMSKPGDPPQSTPLRMRLPKMVDYDYLNSPRSTVVGSTTETIKSGALPPARKKWQDEPPVEVAVAPKTENGDLSRREQLARQLEEIQRAIAEFDAGAQERKMQAKKENQEQLRKSDAQYKRHLAESVVGGYSETKGGAVSIAHQQAINQLFGEQGSSTSSMPQNDCKTQDTTDSGPHEGDSHTRRSSVPPHLRNVVAKKDAINMESVPKGRPPPPPHLRVNRLVTDPTKIIQVKDTPGAPSKQRDNETVDRRSPIPRIDTFDTKKISAKQDTAPAQDVKNNLEIPKTREAQMQELQATAPESYNKKTPAVSKQHRTNPRSKANDHPHLSPNKATDHCPSREIKLRVATIPVDENDPSRRPWVRLDPSRMIPLQEPPSAYWIRQMVPVSYKDSALPARERSKIFYERLAKIEKITGMSGRYPGDPNPYEKRKQRSQHRPHSRTGSFTSHRSPHRQRSYMNSRYSENSPRTYQHQPRPNPKGSSAWNQYAGNHQQRTANQGAARETVQKLSQKSAKQSLQNPARDSSVINEASFSDTEYDESSDVSDEEQVKVNPECRTILLEKIPPAVSIVHIFRALGNTGRIEELEFDEQGGSKALIKFVNKETAAALARRGMLVVPVSPEFTAYLPLAYQTASENKDKPAAVKEEESRILVIGPCPSNFFIAAYIELMKLDAEVKPTFVDYVWELMEVMCEPWPTHFLDVSLQTRGNVIKATATFASIKAAVEVREICGSLEAFQEVKIGFAKDPCQGMDEINRLENQTMAPACGRSPVKIERIEKKLKETTFEKNTLKDNNLKGKPLKENNVKDDNSKEKNIQQKTRRKTIRIWSPTFLL
ncbi:Protein of unknown function [Pyronema omphalodes CBS 100304]|uniref:RRM domain-containing protein n=1 Tax=Pyronema omphalodes (strain CBS 100304) TaxID=1076935 RepID=U4LFW7_PYROM|nr:Protein of unknown function [Pyronema omphalodes CBS 100304]